MKIYHQKNKTVWDHETWSQIDTAISLHIAQTDKFAFELTGHQEFNGTGGDLAIDTVGKLEL
jgi:hypothetical protein